MSTVQSCVIIGAGQAGGRAAKAMRACGFGGSITLLGAEVHPPYERPALSKSLLLDATAQVPWVLPASEYQLLNIDLRTTATAAGIDREAMRVILDDGSAIPYDRLLIATGSRVRQLAIDGLAPEEICYLRSLDDSRLIEAGLRAGRSLAVIGGGFIGLEVAATAAKLGCPVTVVEMADRLLARMGCPEASQLVHAYHLSRGVDLRLGTGVASGEPGRLLLTDGSEISADIVIAGVGVVPETALAEAAGLSVDDGLIVDEYCATSDAAIYAAGDVTRQFNPSAGRPIRLESWQNANAQADAAARSMVGSPTAVTEVPWLWSDQGDLNLQIAGAPVTIDETIVRSDADHGGGVTILQFAAGRLAGGVTVNNGKDMPLIRRLLSRPDRDLGPLAFGDASVPLRKIVRALAA